MSTQPLLSIGEVAARTSLAPSAIRYYESLGLLTSQRTAGNRRRYPRAVLRRLGFIRAATSLGLTLEEISQALATLPPDRTPSKADWARLSKQWRAHLDDRITRLERLRDNLDSCIGCGCLSLRTCALYNPQDAAQRMGEGAVYLDTDDRPEPARRDHEFTRP